MPSYEKISPDGWKRADIALAFTTGKIITLDVRTTDTHCASARKSGSPEAFLKAQEREKANKYAGYYRAFRPYVIDLGGAVSETSYGTIKEITAEAARAAGPRLHWEQFEWAVRIQRHIAAAMVRTTAWLATQALAHSIVPSAAVGRAFSGG